VGRLRPKVAIAENVKGMLIGNAKGYTKLIMARFKELGYRPLVVSDQQRRLRRAAKARVGCFSAPCVMTSTRRR